MHIRFGDLLQEVGTRNVELSYSHLMPKPVMDAEGREKPCLPARLRLKPMDVYRLLVPYLSPRFMEQFRAVFPLALYLAFFQWLVLRQSVSDSLTIGAGLAAVMLGLMLFMEGLKLGLMPLGETIGRRLPQKASLLGVLAVTFLLGVGVTFAEPAIGALQVAGSTVDPVRAPYLYLLLTQWSGWLVLVVGAGVGLAAVLGTLRFIYGWSLKPLIYATLIPLLGLTLAVQFHPELRKIVGLAWDCGGVTTGPVTVPLVLALGIGVASAVVRERSTLSGFGIVTLASLFPILGVLILGIAAASAGGPQAAAGAAAPIASGPPAWYQVTPGLEITLGLRAIIPLVLFLYLVLAWIIRERLKNGGLIRYGLILATAGMILFNLGLTYGLSRLGGQSGGLIPGAFTRIAGMQASPLFSFGVGIGLALLFAWILGFGATLAEPALNALGLTVENLTNGAFKKSLLMYSVSLGVGGGITLGVLKIVFDLPLAYLLAAAYAVALVLTALSTEEYVNIAWDSAGVTTGPVTVPLVLALGLGFGQAVGAVEGFGILAFASVMPIISVLSFGLYVQWKVKRMNRRLRTAQKEESGVLL